MWIGGAWVDAEVDATTMGPVNNEPTAAKTERHVTEALERRASIVTGGK